MCLRCGGVAQYLAMGYSEQPFIKMEVVLYVWLLELLLWQQSMQLKVPPEVLGKAIIAVE